MFKEKGAADELWDENNFFSALLEITDCVCPRCDSDISRGIKVPPH